MAYRTTVFDRSKMNGGFISGPSHSMIGTSDGMQTAKGDTPDESEQGEGGAPNYRDADSMEDCGGCAHFSRSDNQCQKYNFVTSPDKVCDSFEPANQPMPEEENGGIISAPASQ